MKKRSKDTIREIAWALAQTARCISSPTSGGLYRLCWCDMAIGHPSMRDHSPRCHANWDVLERAARRLGGSIERDFAVFDPDCQPEAEAPVGGELLTYRPREATPEQLGLYAALIHASGLMIDSGTWSVMAVYGGFAFTLTRELPTRRTERDSQ